MRSFWERFFFYREITASRVVLASIEVVSFVVVVSALVVGTLTNFTLPRFGVGQLAGCYFADALIVFVECPYNRLLGTVLSWSWLTTWGIRWLIALLPYSLLFLIPELATIWFTACFMRRVFRR